MLACHRGVVRLIARSIYFSIALLFCFKPAKAANQSLQSGTGSVPLPQAAPWTDVSHWRTEIRIHNWSPNGTSYQSIFGTKEYFVRIEPDGNIGLTDWADNGTALCRLPAVGYSDFVVRFQRDPDNSRLTAELWNAADQTQYTNTTCPLWTLGSLSDAGSSIVVGDNKGTGSIAYIRTYSSVVPLGTAPSSTYNGDLFDFEFEGNGQDSSAHGLHLTMSGGSYTQTPTYNPSAIFGGYPASRTFIVGKSPVPLNASGTFSTIDNSPLTYAWSQVSGPCGGTIGSSTSTVTTFTAPCAGTFLLQLTVTDVNGAQSTSQLKFGGVKVKSNGLIDPGNAAIDYLLGPLIPWGKSVYPWFDLTYRADANALAPYHTTPLGRPDEVPLSGTISLGGAQYQQPTMTGVGTHFTTELSVGQNVAVLWTQSDGTLGQIGNSIAYIQDDTHATLSNAINFSLYSLSNVTLNKLTNDYNLWGANSAPNNWNYYDNVLGLYRLYYETGIDDYLNQARAIADIWYDYGMDGGYNLLYPRIAALQGIMLRAEDGHPEYWNGILRAMNFNFAVGGWFSTQFSQSFTPADAATFDPRENGYLLRWMALVAKIHPDSAVRSTACGYVAHSATLAWAKIQDDLGQVQTDMYNINPSYPYKAYQGRYGSEPWLETLAILGLEQSYDVLADASACNNQAAAAATLPVIEKFVAFVHNYGVGSNRGQLYTVGYETSGQNPLAYPGFNSSTPNTVGTLSVKPGSAIVTGSGTNFTTVFWGVPGAIHGKQAFIQGYVMPEPTNYIGIPSECTHLVFKVASIQSDTKLTLTETWPASCKAESGIGANPSASGVGWLATWEANKNCGTSRAVYCEGGPYGDRNLTHDTHAAYLWLHHTTGNAQYLAWGEDSAGADYGGPGGGPGTSGPPIGPLADGQTGFFQDPLPGCNVAATPPCGGDGLPGLLGKPFGQSAGAGNAPNAMAYIALANGGYDNDNQPPTTPLNLTAAATSGSQIHLSWTASSDNLAVVGYLIYRNGSPIGTSVSTTYDSTGLAPLTIYSFTVSAYDTSGNKSNPSNSASAATLAGTQDFNLSLPPFALLDRPLAINFGSQPVAQVSWNFAPISLSPNGTMSSAASIGSPGTASFTTTSNAITPAQQGLVLGTYLANVKLLDAQGKILAESDQAITFVHADLSTVKVYPNPWRSDKHGGHDITFANLSAEARVKIFTLSGHFVRELTQSGASAFWDRKNEEGDGVASGVYVYLITDAAGNKVTGKVAVVK